ncbi:MAG: hypothetical protein M1816_006491 [Peltula sp. TS41687]|nr:MAG: hypothetical protein M1816_006491 [Peltula sp. TS41687]
MSSKTSQPSSFWRSVDPAHTAILLSDLQTQLVAHMPAEEQESYLSAINDLLSSFRAHISQARAAKPAGSFEHDGVPLIIHHVVVLDHSTLNLSPYNKLNNWALRRLQAARSEDPSTNTPKPQAAPPMVDTASTVPSLPHPAQGWSIDEFVLTKQAPSCFLSSDLLKVFGSRGIKHVVLVGLTTEGSILSSCDDKELMDTILEKLVPRFADFVTIEDIKRLLKVAQV